MDYFGIIKFRRVRKVFSKTKGTDVNIYDYVIETLNSDSGQDYAFSVGEDKKKALEAQGMAENVLGYMYFYSKSKTFKDKDGQERDVNNTYPTNFKPYATSAPQPQKTEPTKEQPTQNTEGNDNLPF